MADPRQMRGEKNRVLDPLLARAIARLDQHMVEHGLSQSDVARVAGVDQGRVSRVLAGKLPEVSFYVFARIVRAAGLSVDWVISEPARATPSATPVPSSSTYPSRSG